MLFKPGFQVTIGGRCHYPLTVWSGWQLRYVKFMLHPEVFDIGAETLNVKRVLHKGFLKDFP